jgi:hypothetical protein
VVCRRRWIITMLGLDNEVWVFRADINFAVLSILNGIAWHIA